MSCVAFSYGSMNAISYVSLSQGRCMLLVYQVIFIYYAHKSQENIYYQGCMLKP